MKQPYRPEPGEHHQRDGWYFKRLGDSVRIRKIDLSSGEIALENVVADSEWATIVAHVSARGEDGASFAAALHFHNRNT